MKAWMARQFKLGVCLAVAALWGGQASAVTVEVPIYDIQYTTDPLGDSPYNGSTLNCAGGIVIHKFPGSRPRVILYDPAHPTGWGAIQVKDWTGDSTTSQFYSQVNVGDFVSLTNVWVEEYRGTTFLQYDVAHSAGFSVISTGNPLPPPIPVSLDDISAPDETPPGSGEWYVPDHTAEPYESMYLMVQDVMVTDMDLGKALDNYNLAALAGGTIAGLAEGNVWVSDYVNSDLPPGDLYMPGVAIGATFGAVAGVLEQYTRLSSGWDYYQLLTTSASDFRQQEAAVPEPASVALLLMGIAGLRCARRRRARR